MADTDIIVNVEVECACDECGGALDCRATWRRGEIECDVKPCEYCMREARIDGQSEVE